MKLSMQKNSDVTLIDSTYWVNVEDYSLYTFTALSKKGFGQRDAVGFVVDDREDNLWHSIQLFGQSNPYHTRTDVFLRLKILRSYTSHTKSFRLSQPVFAHFTWLQPWKGIFSMGKWYLAGKFWWRAFGGWWTPRPSRNIPSTTLHLSGWALLFCRLITKTFGSIVQKCGFLLSKHMCEVSVIKLWIAQKDFFPDNKDISTFIWAIHRQIMSFDWMYVSNVLCGMLRNK